MHFLSRRRCVLLDTLEYDMEFLIELMFHNLK